MQKKELNLSDRLEISLRGSYANPEACHRHRTQKIAVNIISRTGLEPATPIWIPLSSEI